jgi:hypothetical protein
VICDDILELVTSGEKDVEVRPEFIEHLKGCARCRDEAPALLAAARAIRAAPVEALAGHPASDQIVALAMDPEAAALEVNRRVAEHVTGCATCTAELQEVRRAEQKRTSLRRRGRPALRALISALRSALPDLTYGARPARVALVTSLGLLLLAYPAFLGLHQFPRVKEQMGDLELRTKQLEAQIRDLSISLAQANQAAIRLSHWSGPLRLFALTSPVRGQTATQTISVDPAEPYVLVSVRPILAEPSAEPDVYRIIVVGTDGRVVWSTELTVQQMRRQMRASGALILPIASSVLAPGKYELRVLPAKHPQEPILQIPFEIVPAA